MANSFRLFVALIVCLPCMLRAQAEVGSVLLNPSAIRITGQFEMSPGPTTLELALRSIEQQIDQKRAADDARSPLESFWKNPLWRFLPTDSANTLNSPVGALPDNLARNPLHLDDPFCTPAYLTFEGKRLDSDLAAFEKRELQFFGH